MSLHESDRAPAVHARCGVPGDRGHPVEKSTAVDLLARAFRFDQEKIEGLALGAGALWVTNDNDGGQAPTLFVKLDPALLSAGSPPPPPDAPPPDGPRRQQLPAVSRGGHGMTMP